MKEQEDLLEAESILMGVYMDFDDNKDRALLYLFQELSELREKGQNDLLNDILQVLINHEEKDSNILTHVYNTLVPIKDELPHWKKFDRGNKRLECYPILKQVSLGKI